MTSQQSLEDRYGLEHGRVFLTGTQALVRLVLEQARRDRSAGLRVGGFVAGYRGSPLGGIDNAFVQAKRYLDSLNVRFLPAVNEELAATMLIGTQQLQNYPGANVEGVFALWYGKGPGLDRAADALKHASSFGSSPRGGALVVVGDDHGAVSSSVAHQSEQTMASWGMPILYPTGPREYIDFGLTGYALSRFSGCLVGFKTVTETVESATSVAVSLSGSAIVIPPAPNAPDGLHNRWPDSQLVQEKRLYEHRLIAAMTFARANRIDRIELDSARPRLGIVAAGKAWLDLLQALSDLGIDAEKCDALGLRAYKIGMLWPLEPEGLAEFAQGLDEILVVEEKRSFLELQIKGCLFNRPQPRPRVVGKSDEKGRPLLSQVGELSPQQIARVLLARMDSMGIAHSAPRPAVPVSLAVVGLPERTPNFCPGCPHSLSVRLPEGSRAFAGAGCHLMTAFTDPATSSLIQMGGEGTNWIGQAPFTETPHVFQNLGDGTYVHSGSLAIRQAVAANANITYKILFNGAVAMTGGQPLEIALTVPILTRQLADEGVRRIAVVSDDLERHRPAADYAVGVTFHHRRELDDVQRALRATKGVSALIFDQPCATERRRQVKRGTREAPTRHVVIHPQVCENCGDCVRQSGCAALVERATPFGRKRHVDPSACSHSYACLEGFCPALVSIIGKPRAPRGLPAGELGNLPEPRIPELRVGRPWRLLVAGIGGAGVVTSGQILGMAATLDGVSVSVLSFTGLAQKGGAVFAHVQFAARDADLLAPRIGEGAADALLASDWVTAVYDASLSRLRRGTRAVVDPHLVPTGDMIRDPLHRPEDAPMRRALAQRVGDDSVALLRASELADAVTGHAETANLLMIGFAWQQGLIPVSRVALERAIELNGAAVAANRNAFSWGRRLACTPGEMTRLLPATESEALDKLLDRHVAFLAAYQNGALGERHRRFVAKVARVLAPFGGSGDELTRTITRAHFRVLAYKDEYEVARLLTDAQFRADMDARFEQGWAMRFHLAPPFLGDRKREFGGWVTPLLKGLSRMRSLRGSPLDPFAGSSERRAQREAIQRYETRIEQMLAGLSPDNLVAAARIAAQPLDVRGFGPIRKHGMDMAEAAYPALAAAFRSGAPHEGGCATARDSHPARALEGSR